MENTFEDRIQHVENQTYILYLQINGLVKELVDAGVVVPDKLIASMDELNRKLYEATQEAATEAAVEVAVDTPVEQGE